MSVYSYVAIKLYSLLKLFVNFTGTLIGGIAMVEGVVRRLVLEGLDCSNCAAIIERRVCEIAGVNSASLNFASKTLTIEAEDKERVNNIILTVRQIVKSLEPGVNIIDGKRENTVNKAQTKVSMYKKILMLIISAVLLGIPEIFHLQFLTAFMLYLASYLISGYEVLLKAVRNIIKGKLFDENFLMSAATIGAFSIGQYPEGVAVMLFYNIGELLQSLAVSHSRKSISALMDIKPDYANVRRGNSIIRVSPEEVYINEIIIVRPGERIPLDGKIVDGGSMVDTSALTGESVFREVEVGSTVLGGFINKNGLLTVKVMKEFSESTVSKILDLVENSSSKKAPTENFISKFARYYTPIVVAASLIIAVVPPLVLKNTSFSEWIYRALVFLVISCPCALVISIPLSFFCGIGSASKNGILIKGSNYLEALVNVDTVVFDKTGTLTKGVFKVTGINPADGMTKNMLLEYAAMAEYYSTHPIALSILKAHEGEINKGLIKKYDEISGYGTKVILDDMEILAGNSKLMEREGINYNKYGNFGTVVYIAINRIYIGNVVISDELKEDSKLTIKKLRDIGVRRIVMLTGDTASAGASFAEQLGIDEVYTELLPDQKVEKLEILEGQIPKGSKLVFMGDGINDAPVLARADVGVAMGGLGSDAAIEAADVVLMMDEPSKLVSAIKIGKVTRSIVMQNILFALGVKALVMVLGALGIAVMWEAVFADVGVTVIAVLNAMRISNMVKQPKN